MGNNNFIEARSSVKRSFIYAIAAAVLSLVYMNYYKTDYKTGLIFKLLAKKHDDISYSGSVEPGIDMIWWLSVIGLVSGIVLIAVVTFCRFKWTSKYFVLIPAGLKLGCAGFLSVMFLMNDYQPMVDAADSEIYSFGNFFIPGLILYIAAFALITLSVILPGKLAKTVGFIGIALEAVLVIATFFAFTPYGISYKLITGKTPTAYAYRSLSVMVSDVLSMAAILSLGTGLDTYNRCIKEDEEKDD